jgi:hypothetical protein
VPEIVPAREERQKRSPATFPLLVALQELHSPTKPPFACQTFAVFSSRSTRQLTLSLVRPFRLRRANTALPARVRIR